MKLVVAEAASNVREVHELLLFMVYTEPVPKPSPGNVELAEPPIVPVSPVNLTVLDKVENVLPLFVQLPATEISADNPTVLPLDNIT